MSEIHTILVDIIEQLRAIRALLVKVGNYIQTCHRSSRLKLPAIAQTIFGLSLATAQSAPRTAALGTSAAALIFAHSSMCFTTSMLQELEKPTRTVLELYEKLQGKLQGLETLHPKLVADLLAALEPLKELGIRERTFPVPDQKYFIVEKIFKSLAPFASNEIVARLEQLMPQLPQ